MAKATNYQNSADLFTFNLLGELIIKMVSIRPALVGDLLAMQQCNLFNLPENYNMRYWMFHITTWSALPHVAVDEATG